MLLNMRGLHTGRSRNEFTTDQGMSFEFSSWIDNSDDLKPYTPWIIVEEPGSDSDIGGNPRIESNTNI